MTTAAGATTGDLAELAEGNSPAQLPILINELTGGMGVVVAVFLLIPFVHRYPMRRADWWKRIPHYLAAVEGGRINRTPSYRFEKTTASTGRLDADHTFGQAAGKTAMRHAIELAREAGSGFVAVRNSTHCGVMAYYALDACGEDMIGLAYTHASPKLRTAGA